MSTLRPTAAAVLLTLTQIGPVQAQGNQRFYLGATSGVETGDRGGIDLGGVSTLGALAGVRLGGGWSIEVEADRGFGESDERVFEGFLFSLQPVTNAEERRRFGVFGRSSFSESAGPGYSAQVTWTTRDPGRVNAGFSAGINWRRFERRHLRTITEVGPDAGIPSDHPELRDIDSTERLTGGGYSAGVLVPIRVGDRLHVVPEAKFTFGGISGEDGFYKVFRTAARVVWGW